MRAGPGRNRRAMRANHSHRPELPHPSMGPVEAARHYAYGSTFASNYVKRLILRSAHVEGLPIAVICEVWNHIAAISRRADR